MMEMLRRFPDDVAIIRSATTRSPRNQDDERWYRFVTREEFAKRQAEDGLVQWQEYAGNMYGCIKEDVERTLETHIGIQAFVEPTIADFRRAGFVMHIVKIIPRHAPDARNEIRRAADADRSTIPLEADLEIENDFLPGGQERAEVIFSTWIQNTLLRQSP